MRDSKHKSSNQHQNVYYLLRTKTLLWLCVRLFAFCSICVSTTVCSVAVDVSTQAGATWGDGFIIGVWDGRSGNHIRSWTLVHIVNLWNKTWLRASQTWQSWICCGGCEQDFMLHSIKTWKSEFPPKLNHQKWALKIGTPAWKQSRTCDFKL